MRRDFHSPCLGHALGLGLWGTMRGWWGQKNKFRNFNQSWCLSYLHEWHNFLWSPPPLGPRGGTKRSNVIKSQLLSQFQRLLNQTMCVFSQMKDIKHIRRDFHLIAWVMPQGWDLWVLWGFGGQTIFFLKFNQRWCASYLHEWHMQQHIFWSPAPWGLGERPRVKYH